MSVTLAIETSTRRGSVTLGRDGAIVESIDLGDQRRHAVALMPAIDRLFRAHGVKPADLAAVFVSRGPGSFTGLRIGITTAKVLARVTGCKLVAVPTLDAIAANVPPMGDAAALAVLLSAKGGRWFAGLYAPGADGWRPTAVAATLMSAEELLAAAPRPLAVVGDCRGELDWPADVRWLDAALARPRSEVIHRIGSAMLDAGLTISAIDLTPLYVRMPDAEEVWRARQAKHATGGVARL